MKKKILVSVVATSLLIGSVFGGTLAYLMDTTDEVKNTFTVGDVSIELAETTHDFKMVPSVEIAKDPVVTVDKDSEASWIFVKVEESDNLDDFIQYSIASGWTELETGVYYREFTPVENATSDTEYHVLTNDKVLTLASVTKEKLEALTADTMPTLTFTAYAIQKADFIETVDGKTGVQRAWDAVKTNPAN